MLGLNAIPHNERPHMPIAAALLAFRTPETQKSDAAWESGHRAAVPILKATGFITIPLTAILFISSFFANDLFQLVAGTLGYAVAIGGILWGTVVANKAPKEVNTCQEDHPH